MTQRMTREMTWTDADGSKALLTTDAETCGDSDAVAVLALLEEREGGIYLTPDDARAVVEFLQEALRSCYEQTLPPKEIIVIDDGSDSDILVPQSPEGIDVRVVRITNRGLPAARNTGLMLARCAAFVRGGEIVHTPSLSLVPVADPDPSSV